MARSSKPIDVLLVNPGSRTAVYQELGDRYSAIEPPSLAGLFATYLKKHGVSVDIVDAPAQNLSPAGVAETIRDMTKIRLKRKLLEAGDARKPALTA